MNDGIQLELGRQLLAYLAVSGIFVTVALIYTGGLQGTGDTRSRTAAILCNSPSWL